MTDMELLKVENLHKRFGDLHVLKGVTEHITQGEVVSVIGPSGGGKSTFLRCLNLLEIPDEGKIYFEGVDITDKKVDINVHRQKMGMVFQHFNVFPNMTVGKNITMAPVLLGKKSQKDADEMAKDLLNRVGLLDKIDEYPKRLSGGQKQRLTIARALVKKPEILILDDSASALDFATDAALRKSLNRLDWKVTTFLVSQRSSSIQQADLILVLDNGTLAGKGTHAELLRTCDTYREIYFSQFPEERARYSSVSAGNIMKEVTV